MRPPQDLYRLHEYHTELTPFIQMQVIKKSGYCSFVNIRFFPIRNQKMQ